ncbi:hypothetical protein [Butyrivibrio sp. AC2005]|uniref:hypothetical protein n=1 Tax=Butyrivibrio sp. AC2005 TaxID=1280672 RepID=UPI0003F987CF|nr:hypothetical protein [Butyrivibrio sp. AC2005]
MGELFGVKQSTLSEHINNIIDTGELDGTSIGFSDKSTGGRKPKIYNLDMILSVGYVCYDIYHNFSTKYF